MGDPVHRAVNLCQLEMGIFVGLHLVGASMVLALALAEGRTH